MKKRCPVYAVVLTCFFIFAYWLDTRLIYMVMAPGFQMRLDFLAGMLSHPGGLVDFFAALLGQFLYFRLAGALALTTLATVLLLLSEKLVFQLCGDRDQFASYVPLLIFTGMVATYYFALSAVFSVLALLFFSLLWIRMERSPKPVRVVILTLLSGLLFFFSVSICPMQESIMMSGPFHRFFGDEQIRLFPFSACFFLAGWLLICLLFEFNRGYLSGWTGKIWAVLIPLAICAGTLPVMWYFYFPFESINIGAALPFVPFWQFLLSLAMYGSLVSMLAILLVTHCLAGITTRLAVWSAFLNRPVMPHLRCFAYVVPLVFLFAASLLPRWSPFDVTPSHILGRKLAISRHVRTSNYDEAIRLARKPAKRWSLYDKGMDGSFVLGYYTSSLALDVNLALHKTGRLLDEMFHWPQPMQILDSPSKQFGSFVPVSALHSHYELSVYDYERKADVLLRLGRTDDALHLAYEMMAFIGPRYRPDLFWHLARLYLVRDESKKARIYLNNLADDPVHRRAALRYLDMLCDDLVSAQITALRRRMLEEDDVQETVVLYNDAQAVNVHRQMLNLLERNPANRMALDYFFAMCLCYGDVSSIAKNLHRLAEAGYSKLPRHIQEALIVYASQGGSLPEAVISSISRHKISDFTEFSSIVGYHMQRWGEISPDDLKKFDGTYWYYLHGRMRQYPPG